MRKASGTVTVHGGKITVTGGESGAGIGGGGGKGAGGVINIYGGKVTATGDEDSSGLGSGQNGAGGTITLSWTQDTDSIKASSFGGTVKIMDGKSFSDGARYYSGTLQEHHLEEAAGKTLVPAAGGIHLISADAELISTDAAARSGDVVSLDYLGQIDAGREVAYFVDGEEIEGSSFEMPDKDVTVTAVVRYIPYTISYDLRAGASHRTILHSTRRPARTSR